MELQEALDGLKAKTTSFDDVKEAIAAGHVFTKLEPIDTVEGIGLNWDYVPTPGSFRDTIESAMWRGVLSRDQVKELRALAFGKVA